MDFAKVDANCIFEGENEEDDEVDDFEEEMNGSVQEEAKKK
jgi:hypothetical protein